LEFCHLQIIQEIEMNDPDKTAIKKEKSVTPTFLRGSIVNRVI
jgi:hypothetical protein